MRRTKLLSTLLLGLLTASFAPPEAANAPYIATFKVTPQGPLDVLVYPAQSTTSSRTAAIILFHGGAFVSGNPSQFDYYARYFSEERGVTVLLPEYRLVNSSTGVSLVETVHDVHSIIRLVRHRASLLGVDPNRIAVGGSSAGGHLAAIAATIDGYNDPNDPVPPSTSHSPDLVLGFNPSLDLGGGTTIWGISEAQADAFSPLRNLDQNTADAWHLTYGSLDPLIAMGVLFSTQVINTPAYGIEHERWLMQGASHGFIHLPEYRGTVAYYLDLFLEEHGYLSGPPVVLPDPGLPYHLVATTPGSEG